MALALVIKGANFSENKLDTVELENQVPCTAISLDQQSKSLTLLTSFTLTATKTPMDTTDVVVWSSSDSSVATVANGVVTAVGIGHVTITAVCGTQSATCAVDIVDVPSYNVIGAINPYRTSSDATGAFVNVVDTSGNGTKWGGIGFATSDTSIKTIDRTSENAGDYRLCPIHLPNGAKRVKIESKLYSGSTLITFKTRFTWFDSTKTVASGYSGAKVLAGIGSDSNWDQNSLASSVIVDVPNTAGIDSFACAIYMSDWVLAYNTDYSQYFDVTILSEADD